MENLTYKFLTECIYKRKISQINDDLECIIKVNETPCYIEYPSKETIDIKGKKN